MNPVSLRRSWITLFAATLHLPLTALAQGPLTLANPHWNITLTDFGYSDFLLDNTPGFEGREYLSGEWGAAVGYQVAGGPNVNAQWLEPKGGQPRHRQTHGWRASVH
jgi:hypothetical protein